MAAFQVDGDTLDPDEVIERAAEFEGAGRVTEAETELRSAMERLEDNSKIRRALAWLDWRNYRVLPAYESFERLLQEDPSDIDATRGLALSLWWFELWGRAHEVVRRGLLRAPSDPVLNAVAAYLFVELGRFDSATQCAALAGPPSDHSRSYLDVRSRLRRRGWIVSPVRLLKIDRRAKRLEPQLSSQFQYMRVQDPEVLAVGSVADDIEFRVECTWRRLARHFAWEEVSVRVLSVCGALSIVLVVALLGLLAETSGSIGGLLAIHVSTALLAAAVVVLVVRLLDVRFAIATSIVGGCLLAQLIVAGSRDADEGLLSGFRLGVSSGLRGAAILLWLYVVAVLLRRGLFLALWRRQRRMDPMGWAYAQLCRSLGVASRPSARYDAYDRRLIAFGVEETARSVELILGRGWLRRDLDVDPWLMARQSEITGRIRSLKRAVLVPDGTGLDSTKLALQQLVFRLAAGDLQLDISAPAALPTHTRAKSRRDIMRGVLLAVVPVILAIVVSVAPLGMTAQAQGWITTVLIVFGVVSLLGRIDPLFSERVRDMRELTNISMPGSPDRRPGTPT